MTTGETAGSALILVGAGEIGIEGATALRDAGIGRPSIVVDPDADARVRAERALGVPAVASLDQASGSYELALVAFSSRAAVAAPVIAQLLAAGVHVITTCEELANPSADEIAELEARCHDSGRSVVVAGANPGFVMDRLPLLLSGGCLGVRSIRVERRVDTRSRRPALVAKTGRGMTPEQFRHAAEVGEVGHVGLEASARALAAGLGWHATEVSQVLEPVVDGGSVLGQHQWLRLSCDRQREIELELDMVWDLKDPRDRISIDGDSSLVVDVLGGFPGDEGTVARIVHSARCVGSLRPSIYGPGDLPVSL